MPDETVKVIVRCRPMNSREKGLKCDTSVEVHNELGQIQLRKVELGTVSFLANFLLKLSKNF